jgi:hypothetical protein
MDTPVSHVPESTQLLLLRKRNKNAVSLQMSDEEVGEVGEVGEVEEVDENDEKENKIIFYFFTSYLILFILFLLCKSI